MKERPILMNGEMVRATLTDRKTQTRRAMKPQPTYDGFWWSHKGYSCGGEKQFRDGLPLFVGCPHGKVGDRLWVRETWVELLHTSPATDDPILCDGDKLLEPATQYRDSNGHMRWHYNGRVIAYRATSDVEFCDGDGFCGDGANRDDMPRWKPSIHMRREFSRITLEITGVRVERLNEISEADAYSEGVTIPSGQSFASNGSPELRNEARCAFQSLWNSINGPESWAANPFVWVIEFKRIEAT